MAQSKPASPTNRATLQHETAEIGVQWVKRWGEKDAKRFISLSSQINRATNLGLRREPPEDSQLQPEQQITAQRAREIHNREPIFGASQKCGKAFGARGSLRFAVPHPIRDVLNTLGDVIIFLFIYWGNINATLCLQALRALLPSQLCETVSRGSTKPPQLARDYLSLCLLRAEGRHGIPRANKYRIQWYHERHRM